MSPFPFYRENAADSVPSDEGRRQGVNTRFLSTMHKVFVKVEITGVWKKQLIHIKKVEFSHEIVLYTDLSTISTAF